MQIAQFFFERPYVARGLPAPDKSGIAYAFHVCVGLKHWLRYEMPLLPAWGICILSYAVFIAGMYVTRITEESWWHVPLLLCAIPLALFSPIALIVVVMVSVRRLFDGLGRMCDAGARTLTNAWHTLWSPIGSLLHEWWEPIGASIEVRWLRTSERLSRIGTWLTGEPQGPILLVACFITVILAITLHDPGLFVREFNAMYAEQTWFFTIMKYMFGLYVCLVVLNIILALAAPLIRRLRKRPE